MAVRQIEPIDRAELRATIQKWIDAHTDVDDTDGVGLLEDVLWEINAQPTLTQPNEPLTLEELREMSGQPFWDDAGSGWWIVAHVDGSKIYTEEGAILDFYEEGEEDIYFRRPPEGEEETP